MNDLDRTNVKIDQVAVKVDHVTKTLTWMFLFMNILFVAYLTIISMRQADALDSLKRHLDSLDQKLGSGTPAGG